MSAASRRCFRLIPALLWAGISFGAAAHTTSLTRGDVVLRDDIVVYRLTVQAHDLAVALGIETDLLAPVPKSEFEDKRQALENYLGAGLQVASDAGPCPLLSVTPDYRSLPETMAAAAAFRCPAPPKWISLGFRLFFEIDPAHRNLGEVHLPERRIEFLFDAGNASFEFDTAGAPPDEPSWGARFLQILVLGIEHIGLGIDHILFLIALVIVRPRAWPLVKVVTAFTVAHSITLALAWYGAVDPPVRPIEILIAASIAFVAVQNLLNRGMDRRWLVAFGFGLIHGLGFYAALRDLDLVGADAATILLGFNLGVEIGQLAIVGLAAGLLVPWRDRGWYGGFARAVSLLILIAASYWIVERSIGA